MYFWNDEAIALSAINHQWKLYSDPNRCYSTMYAAYRKICAIVKDGIRWGWAWAKDFIINNKKQVRQRIIRYTVSFNDINRPANWFYLMYFYDEEGNFLYSKLGKTTKALSVRAKQHQDCCVGEAANVAEVKIVYAWDCGRVNCEQIEVQAIDFMKTLYPDTYKRTDRFTMLIKPEMLDERVKKWLAIFLTAYDY